MHISIVTSLISYINRLLHLLLPLHFLHLSGKTKNPFLPLAELSLVLHPIIGLFIYLSLFVEFFGMLSEGTHTRISTCL